MPPRCSRGVAEVSMVRERAFVDKVSGQGSLWWRIWRMHDVEGSEKNESGGEGVDLADHQLSVSADGGVRAMLG